MESKPIKHKLLRKHRIVIWEDGGNIGIGKIENSIIKQRSLKTILSVHEIVVFRRNFTSTFNMSWESTYDTNTIINVPISKMRLPTTTDRSLYNFYRHK